MWIGYDIHTYNALDLIRDCTTNECIIQEVDGSEVGAHNYNQTIDYNQDRGQGM